MVTFSNKEIKDLSIAIIVITLIFTFIFTRSTGISIESIILVIPMALVTVGLSFILHELGHKIVAQNYGYYAEFRRDDRGLLIAVVTALLGFVFLAPGAVMIASPTGYISEKENGIISVAGPLVNIVLALIFLFIGLTVMDYPQTIFMIYIYMISTLGFSINSFLALFNLLPIPPLDGSKVLNWNLGIWLITIIFAGLLTFASYQGILGF